MEFETQYLQEFVHQVKLNQCTKLLDPATRSLCAQSSYIGESPASTYKKTLCCDSCGAFANKDGKAKQLRLYLGLGAAGTFLIVLVYVVAILVCKYVVAQSPVKKMKEGHLMNTLIYICSSSIFLISSC